MKTIKVYRKNNKRKQKEVKNMRFIKDQINIKDKERIQTQKGITLIALAITIVLNCSFLAMV